MLFYLGGEPNNLEWAETMAVVALSLTSMAQGFSSLACAYYVAEGMRDPQIQEQLKNLPLDEAVEEADERGKQLSERYLEVTAWTELPCIMRGLLLFAFSLMT